MGITRIVKSLLARHMMNRGMGHAMGGMGGMGRMISGKGNMGGVGGMRGGNPLRQAASTAASLGAMRNMGSAGAGAGMGIKQMASHMREEYAEQNAFKQGGWTGWVNHKLARASCGCMG